MYMCMCMCMHMYGHHDGHIVSNAKPCAVVALPYVLYCAACRVDGAGA